MCRILYMSRVRESGHAPTYGSPQPQPLAFQAVADRLFAVQQGLAVERCMGFAALEKVIKG